jgi:membrane protein
MKTLELWDMARHSVAAWIDDYAPSMGAALAYYTMFSIAPLLVIVIAVAGILFGNDAAKGHVLAELRGIMGEEGALAVEGLLESASDPEKSSLAALVGIIALLVGATSVFAELQSALDRIWRAEPTQPSESVWRWVQTRMLSLGMILGFGFLLLVSLVMSAALAALGDWWGPLFGAWELILQTLNFIVSFVIVTLIFAMIYKSLPHVSIDWRDVWIGATVTALLFTVGKLLIGFYLGRTSIASAFGAAGSLVVLLLWVYYSAQIFLLGAEFTWVYAHRHGSRAGQASA